MTMKLPTKVPCQNVLIDLINGKKVNDPLFTGLDECTEQNKDNCPAQ